jgi:hypothetical protein
MAIIASLQEQLRVQLAIQPTSVPPPAAGHGIPPAITVTLPMTPAIGALQTPGLPVAPVGPSTPAQPPPLPPAPTAPAGILRSTTPVPAPTGPVAPPPSTPADRWYAVVVGRDPSDTGVYKGYANVGPLVTGVSGAILQGGFKTKGEAESYLSSVISLPTSATPTRRQKWYVVCVGQDPSDRGVYDNWPTVALKVVGVAGAVYQGGFKSRSEAKAFLASTPRPTPAPAPAPLPATVPAQAHQHPGVYPPGQPQGAPQYPGIGHPGAGGHPPYQNPGPPSYPGTSPYGAAPPHQMGAPPATTPVGHQGYGHPTAPPGPYGTATPPPHYGYGPGPASPYGGQAHPPGVHQSSPYGQATPGFGGPPRE